MAETGASSLLRPPERPALPLDRLAPEAALRRLELAVVRRLEGYLQGDHLGLLPGPGSDPNDARPYQPGEDDVRKIDWPVTARTRVTHVRDTIADRELEVWGLLDVTPSMNWGTAGITKLDLGIAALATFGFLSQRMGDRFGGMVLRPDRVRRFPARSGRTALYGLLRSLLQEPIAPDSTEPGLPLSRGIDEVGRAQRRRGLRIIVSDFLTPGDAELDPAVPPEWERALRRLSVRNQVIAVEVLDRHEIEFPDVGDMLLRSPDTAFQGYVNTADPRLRRAMDRAARLQRERTRLALRRSGVGHIQLRTDGDWVAEIARFALAYRRTAGMLHRPPQGVAR